MFFCLGVAGMLMKKFNVIFFFQSYFVVFTQAISGYLIFI